MQGLDRYAYANNSPIVYSDPSGNIACDGENSIDGCQGVTFKDLSKLVKFDYGWTLSGKWSKHNIEKLLKYSSNFAYDIFNLTGKNGTTWIRNHVGNAILHMGPIADMIMDIVGTTGMVLTNADVLLPGSFTEYTLIHEMGHVFDNNVKNGFLPATYNGRGPSDAMVAALGGNPGSCSPRFQCGFKPFTTNNVWYQANVSITELWDISAYANNGVADDFADTFAFTLMGYILPAGRQLWMTSFLTLLP